MKINIVQHCRAALICWLCITIVTGSNKLKIFRKVDGTVVKVPSKIEVLNGADLTFVCQVEIIKNEGITNGYVTWFIPPEIHSELKIRVLGNSSNLIFRNVNTNDEGLYVCASLKFKIFKTIHLLVKQSKPAENLSFLNFPRLAKRAVNSGDGLDDIDFSNLYHENPHITDQVNKANAMHEDITKRMQKVFDDLNNNPKYDEDFNKFNKSNKNFFMVTTIVTILGVLFAGFVIFLLIRICQYRCRNSSTNRDNHQQNVIYNPAISDPNLNRCEHASCSSDTCSFHGNSLSTTTVINNAMVIEEPLIHNSLNPTTQFDLPPTYSSSAHNSTQNLNEATNGFDKTKLDAVNSNKLNSPPSYSEAIGHKDDNHIVTVSHNNGNLSSGHNHGVDNSHVDHSTEERINGNDDSGGGGSND